MKTIAVNRSMFVLLALVVAAWAVWPSVVRAQASPGEATAGFNVPPLDEFLRLAMANHPDIEVAQKKVELAQSELREVRFRVSRELIELRSEWAFEAENVERLKGTYREGVLPVRQLTEAQARLAQIEAKIKVLLHPEPFYSPGSRIKAAPASAEPPQGPLAEVIREALNRPIQVDFVDTPLQEVLVLLSETTKINFRPDPEGLANAGLSTDMPITLKLSNVPLGAVLQAIEDFTGNLKFVIRDYGIVATAFGSPLSDEAVSAVNTAVAAWHELVRKQRERAEKK